MEVDKFDVDKLISEIEKRPALWDMTKSEYSDRIKRKENWEDITNIFAGEHATVEEKKEIGELRERFAREIQSQKGKSGDGARKKAPYVYSQQLLFLKDTLTPRKTTDTLEDLNTQASNAESEESRPTSSSSSITATAKCVSGRPIVGKKRSQSALEDKIFSSLESYEKRVRMESPQNYDDNSHFLLSLVPSLASLPKMLNTKCRIELMQVISKYESYASQQPQQQQPVYFSQQAQQHSVLSRTPQQTQEQPTYLYAVQKNSLSNNQFQADYQEQSRVPVPTPSPAGSVQSYLSNFSPEEESEFSVF